MCLKEQSGAVNEEKVFKQLLDEVYSPPTVENEFEGRLRAVIQFCELHEDYVIQSKRYMEFIGLIILLSPSSFGLYYVLLNIMLDFSKKTNDLDSMTAICKSLELRYNRINVAIIKSVINTLLEFNSYKNAGELCFKLNEWQCANAAIDKKRLDIKE